MVSSGGVRTSREYTFVRGEWNSLVPFHIIIIIIIWIHFPSNYTVHDSTRFGFFYAWLLHQSPTSIHVVIDRGDHVSSRDGISQLWLDMMIVFFSLSLLVQFHVEIKCFFFSLNRCLTNEVSLSSIIDRSHFSECYSFHIHDDLSSSFHMRMMIDQSTR